MSANAHTGSVPVQKLYAQPIDPDIRQVLLDIIQKLTGQMLTPCDVGSLFYSSNVLSRLRYVSLCSQPQEFDRISFIRNRRLVIRLVSSIALAFQSYGHNWSINCIQEAIALPLG